MFNIKGKSISHSSVCHLFSSGWAVATANMRQTFPYLKEGFISVTNRLMRYVCFKTSRLILGFITQRNEQVLDCLLWEVFFQKTRVNTLSCRTWEFSHVCWKLVVKHSKHSPSSINHLLQRLTTQPWFYNFLHISPFKPLIEECQSMYT